MAVLLLMLNEIMPKSVQIFPLVGRYIVASMILTIVATLIAVVLMYALMLSKAAPNLYVIRYVDTIGGRQKKMPAWLKSLACLSTKIIGISFFAFSRKVLSGK